MNPYGRRQQFAPPQRQKREPISANPQHPEESPIKVDGYQQVIEMLKAADPEFRASLLKRIEERNRPLAIALKKNLWI
jgi:hypothetical protein